VTNNSQQIVGYIHLLPVNYSMFVLLLVCNSVSIHVAPVAGHFINQDMERLVKLAL